MNDTLDAFADDSGEEDLSEVVEEEAERLIDEMEETEGTWPSILDEESSWYSSAHDGEMPSVESVVSKLQDAAWICEGLRALDPEKIDQEEHAELVSALKSLRKTVKKTRKEFVEPPLKEDLEEGDRVGTLVVTRGTSKRLRDEDAALEAIEEAGGDPTQAMTVKRTKFEKVADALGLDVEEYVQTSHYHYLREDS